MNKFKVIIQSLAIVLMTILIQILVAYLSGIYFTIKLRTTESVVRQEDILMFIREYNLIIILIGWLMTLLLIYIIVKLSKQNIFNVIKLDVKMSILHIAICCVAAMGLNMAINGLISITNITKFFPDYEEVISSIVNHNFYLTLICVGILIPICEEILYRGIIFNKLRSGLSIYWAIIIQAVLFGLSHMNVIQGAYSIILGIVFAFVVIWTNSLISSIAIHITINTMSVILPNTNQDTSGNIIFITLVGVILSIISLRILHLDRTKNNNIVEFNRV